MNSLIGLQLLIQTTTKGNLNNLKKIILTIFEKKFNDVNERREENCTFP